jgi:hypothetical protein
VADDGVVHEDVDGAEPRSGSRHHRFDFSRMLQIGGTVQRPGAESFFKVAPDGCDLIGLRESVEHDVTTSFGESLGRGEAEALGGTRDQRRFTLQHGCGPYGPIRNPTTTAEHAEHEILGAMSLGEFCGFCGAC